MKNSVMNHEIDVAPKARLPKRPSQIQIVVRENKDAPFTENKRFVAQILGLRVLKCAGMCGSGPTKDTAICDLKRKLLQFLDFSRPNEPPY